jgi:hypothetical protein
MKSQVFLSGINCSKTITEMSKVMKDVVIQDLTELMKKCKFWYIQMFKYQSCGCATKCR